MSIVTVEWRMKAALIAVGLMVLSGCAVKYNPVVPKTEQIDNPPVGVVSKAQIGDHLITKGVLVEQEVLNLKQPVDGFYYDIHVGTYPKLGDLEGEQFFSPVGVVRNPLADQFQSISVKSEKPSQVCVVTVMTQRSCYDAVFDIKSVTSTHEANFQQTLIYSGRVGNKINVSYREFSGNTARPAFNNDVEYDLATSRRIGYKGAELEVIEADNTSITYKVISSFR